MIYAVYKWQKTEVVTNISLPQKRFMSHGIPPKKPYKPQPSYSLSSRYWTQSIESNRQSHDGITGALNEAPVVGTRIDPGRFTYFEPHSPTVYGALELLIFRISILGEV